MNPFWLEAIRLKWPAGSWARRRKGRKPIRDIYRVTVAADLSPVLKMSRTRPARVQK